MSEAQECLAPSRLDGMFSSPAVVVAHVVVVVLALGYLSTLHIVYHLRLWIKYLTTPVPLIEVKMTDAELKEVSRATQSMAKFPLLIPNTLLLCSAMNPLPNVI